MMEKIKVLKEGIRDNKDGLYDTTKHMYVAFTH